MPFPSWLLYAQKDFLALDGVGWSAYYYPRVCVSFMTLPKGAHDPRRAIFAFSIISDCELAKCNPQKLPDFAVAVLVAVGVAISGEVWRNWAS